MPDKVSVFSSSDLPFPDCAVDAVICDVPFGNKHSTVESVRRLMSPLVSSLNRLVRVVSDYSVFLVLVNYLNLVQKRVSYLRRY
jgi:tRNA G10  N-methylase Trm11